MSDKVSVVGRGIDRPNAERDAESRKFQAIADDQFQMSTPQGRKWTWNILRSLGYSDPIQEINAKAYGLAAKQEVALNLAKRLKKHCRDHFYLMEVENDGL